MPTPIVHLCTAKKILESFEIKDKPMFYLGSISPDAFYLAPTYYDLDGFYERHKTAHFTNRDFSEWKRSVIKFIEKNKANKNRDFYLGYGVHILTDIYWKETTFMEFRQKFNSDEYSHDERRKMFYNDAEIFENELYNKFNLKSDVWGYLTSCEKIGLKGFVSADETYSWKENTMRLFDNNEDKPDSKIYFFTYGIVSQFIENAAKEILKFIGAKL